MPEQQSMDSLAEDPRPAERGEQERPLSRLTNRGGFTHQIGLRYSESRGHLTGGAPNP
jgi:hypothetical protein